MDDTEKFATWAAHMLHCSLWADAYDDAPDAAQMRLPGAGPAGDWCHPECHPTPIPKATQRCALAWVKTISTQCFDWLLTLPDAAAETIIHDAVLGAMGHGCAFDDHVKAPAGLEWSAGSLEDCSYSGVIGPRGGLIWANAHLPDPVPAYVTRATEALHDLEKCGMVVDSEAVAEVEAEAVRAMRPNRRHDWRLNRAEQRWVCRHCQAELPNIPAGRARALENRRCNEVDRRDVQDEMYQLHRRSGLMGALLGAAAAVGAPALGR